MFRMIVNHFKNKVQTPKKKRPGYILHNPEENITITCTPKFLPLWLRKGFQIVAFVDHVKLVGE